MSIEQFGSQSFISLAVHSASSIFSLGGWTSKKGFFPSRKIEEGLSKDARFGQSVGEIQRILSDLAGQSRGTVQTADLCVFLESPSAENIARQMLAVILQNAGSGVTNGNLEFLKVEFELNLRGYFPNAGLELSKLSDKLFDAILSTVMQTLDSFKDEHFVSERELKSIAQRLELTEELAEIRAGVDFLRKSPRLNLETILDFEVQYRKQLKERAMQITIPHFDRAPKIDLDKIFVSPKLSAEVKQEQVEKNQISLIDFLNEISRTIVLGDPGGGKSTLVQKICYELTHEYDKRLIQGRLLTPIPIVVRDYSAKKDEKGMSILEFIESECKSKYQIPDGAPPGAVEYLLRNGHALVIFDGLDEVIEPNHRREVSLDVEAFSHLFPSAPVLVTSRRIGYEEAPLDGKRFAVFTLLQFDSGQIGEYVRNWFDIDPDLSQEERAKRIKAFMSESMIVQDLRSNPLMLALMCNLYRGAGYIPRHRPAVYKRCTEMLFERWDRSRGIWQKQSDPALKFLLNHLAYWVYSDESLQSGISEEKLVKKLVEFLVPDRFEKPDEAERAAIDFVEFCRGRAWVFTDVGIDQSGALLYKFTHKTFLEYFTAGYLVRKNSLPEELWNLLRPKIASRAWDEVAQLAFQMQDEQKDGAADSLMTLLVESSSKEPEKRWSYLSFASRCLQFMLPSLKVVRTLADTVMRVAVLEEGHLETDEVGRRREESVAGLLQATAEFREVISDEINSKIETYALGRYDPTASRAISMALTSLGTGSRHFSDIEKLRIWDELPEGLKSKVQERAYQLAKSSFAVLTQCIHQLDLPLEQLFDNYPSDRLFQETQLPVFVQYYYPSIVATIIRSCAPVPVAQVDTRVRRHAAAIGRFVAQNKDGVFSRETVESFVAREPNLLRPQQVTGFPQVARKARGVRLNLSGDEFFGLWCIWAAIFEAVADQTNIKKNLETSGLFELGVSSRIMEARDSYGQVESPRDELDSIGLSALQIKYISDWVSRRTSIIKNGPRASTNGRG